MSRTFHARRLTWALLLLAVGSCALPELTIDSTLDDEDDEDDGGTAGDNGGGGTTGNGGSSAGRGGSPSGGSGDSGGTSGTDQGGKGGASGGTDGTGGATGGKGGATGGTAGTGGCDAAGDCDSGESCCAGTCVDTDTDRDHCGACGTACPAPRACTDGRCACASGLTYCGSLCVNTTNSLAHCGRCDSPCGPDQACTQSACTGPCGATFAVRPGGWVTAPGANGSCWRGYPYIVQNPTTAVSPMDFEDCGMGGASCVLCMDGMLPADPQFRTFASLTVSVAMASNGSGSSIRPSGNAVQVSFTNAAGSPLRVLLNGENDTDDERWCFELGTTTTSPVVIPYSDFRTVCWDSTMSQPYAGDPITSIAIQVPGHNTDVVPVDVCLTGFADVIDL